LGIFVLGDIIKKISEERRNMKKYFLKISVILVFLLFIFILQAFASCEECNVTQSCQTYQECMAASLNCLAACREKEAAVIAAESSERVIEVQERTIETLREIFIIAQRTAELLERLTLKINEKN
jgi:hypothetical protein